jgi:hypothetical protein
MQMDRSAFDKMQTAPQRLKDAIKGLTPQDLQAFPIPGTWSIQQIVIHLVDSDLIIAERIKRIIAEPKPEIAAFDESLWTKNLFYHDQSVEDALALMELNRRQITRVLRKLDPALFDRVGFHSERGPLKLSQFVDAFDHHVDHHLKFIREKRAKLGKPLKD